MKSKKTKILGAALALGLTASVGAANAIDLADDSLFQLSEASSTLQGHDGEGHCGEGKCGEGKCGEGKCGEGKCGEGHVAK